MSSLFERPVERPIFRFHSVSPTVNVTPDGCQINISQVGFQSLLQSSGCAKCSPGITRDSAWALRINHFPVGSVTGSVLLGVHAKAKAPDYAQDACLDNGSYGWNIDFESYDSKSDVYTISIIPVIKGVKMLLLQVFHIQTQRFVMKVDMGKRQLVMAAMRGAAPPMIRLPTIKLPEEVMEWFPHVHVTSRVHFSICQATEAEVEATSALE